MPTLSWNEIRQRAIGFSRDWRSATAERAEAQTFWNELFEVFGVRRRTVASFEEPVKSLKNTYQRIDLFWRGRMLAEHKSAGESLDTAESQAFDYIQQLATNGRDEEIPRYVVVSNFRIIALYDLEPEDQLDLPLWRNQRYSRIQFPLADLHKHINLFGFFIGQQTHRFGEDDPANVKAANLMAALHDAVESSQYDKKALERLLVRLLFCLFADDTGIFETTQFELFLTYKSRSDGSDLGAQLNALFETLNTPTTRRPTNWDVELLDFPYVNGELFAERLPLAGFSRAMRDLLLRACRFDWSRISPAIFGSLFQGIMDPKERRQIGAHYTSERDIMKVIRPLFLDGLIEEFERVKADRSKRRKARLHDFQARLAALKFLDPACGCGNFLVIAYRELRKLELEVLKQIYGFDRQGQVFSGDELAKLSQVDVDAFYGIEIGEWPARIAETALWLTDHQMNTELSTASGNVFQRIPLRAAPHISINNALQMDWNTLLPAGKCSYLLGNPPFVGKKEQSPEQKRDHDLIWDGTKGAGILDYVTCWYVKAAEYSRRSKIRSAFVSTNSICQGEQAGVMWARLQGEIGLVIQFAHTTFSWRSEAKGAAHVHVVIIGFGFENFPAKTLYVYENIKGDPKPLPADNINGYLADAPNVTISNRSEPICAVPPVNYGSMMIDKDRKAGMEDGLIIDDEERKAILAECPEVKKYVRKLYGGEEYINGTWRWCLWLVGAPAQIIRNCPRVKRRIEGVRAFRLGSGREATRKLAATPYLFGEIRQPETEYLLIPKVSSENRMYIPMGFLPPNVIASGSALILPAAGLFHFGVLTSAIHMSWVRAVGGRMKSDPQYSSQLIYNNFPWPSHLTSEAKKLVEMAAQNVLDARQPYLDAGSTLADLYDPMTMPGDLLRAHRNLDIAVDRCYRQKKFLNERERVGFLFNLYEQIVSPLALASPAETGRKKGRKR